MATVAAAKVKEFDASTLEKIAYSSVKSIPTREPNDQFRLGYCVWDFLSTKKGTLEQAVKYSGARVLIPETEVLTIIKQELKKSGIEF